MKASIVDLRYKTTDILKALDRNESVTVLYHGKVKGVIKPARGKSISKAKDHLFLLCTKRVNKRILFKFLVNSKS